MKVARSLDEVVFDKNTVVTVGTFDGVHRGHVAIMERLKDRAAARGARSVVVTFDPHPKEVLGAGPVYLLASLDERLEAFRGVGVDLAFVVRFTYEFSRQTSTEFFERYIVRGLGVSEVIVGHDHMFGRDREAGFEELQAMGRQDDFTASAVEAITVEGKIVSSSAIRKLLASGTVDEAALDRGVAPCDDFYRYACGGWKKATSSGLRIFRWPRHKRRRPPPPPAHH